MPGSSWAPLSAHRLRRWPLPRSIPPFQTGAVDGQDNPLPTVVDAKFYEVTGQIVLTSHLVDLNYIALSKAVWDEMTPEQQATVQEAAGSGCRGWPP